MSTPAPHTEVKMSQIPNCDICQQQGNTVPAEYDGKTQMGPWAYMCKRHFDACGVGVGLGRGQKLILKKSA